MLKCLLNVLVSPSASPGYPFPSLLISLAPSLTPSLPPSLSFSLPFLHSCSLMCKHVHSLNPLCIPFVVNVAVPYCLITPTVSTNLVVPCDNGTSLSEAALFYYRGKQPDSSPVLVVLLRCNWTYITTRAQLTVHISTHSAHNLMRSVCVLTKIKECIFICLQLIV